MDISRLSYVVLDKLAKQPWQPKFSRQERIMALLEVLTNDMKEAMKARAAERLNTIRLLISDLKTERINKMRDLTAERIRAAIASYPFEYDGRTMHLTASFGVAETHLASGASLEIIMGRSARALLRAKSDGKDRVVCYSSLNDGG